MRQMTQLILKGQPELHGIKRHGSAMSFPMPAPNRAIRNKWVSLRVTDALCLDGNHAFTAGGCRSSKCECQCHLGQQWRQENNYVRAELPDDPPF